MTALVNRLPPAAQSTSAPMNRRCDANHDSESCLHGAAPVSEERSGGSTREGGVMTSPWQHAFFELEDTIYDLPRMLNILRCVHECGDLFGEFEARTQ
jgi:hypothetical protein